MHKSNLGSGRATTFLAKNSLNTLRTYVFGNSSNHGCKGLAQLANIFAKTMFLVMFPGVAKLGNICFGRKPCVREAKKFLTPGENIFLLSEQQNLFPQHVSRAAKLGDICIRNNVS